MPLKLSSLPLQASLPYELGWEGAGYYRLCRFPLSYLSPGPVHTLAAHRGTEAAEQFKKVIANLGVVSNDPTVVVISRLQLGRAFASSGDRKNAMVDYEDFLNRWKDADSDIPILKAAKSEYAGLKSGCARLPDRAFDRMHEIPLTRVITYVSRLLPLCLTLGVSLLAAPDTRLDPLLHSVEAHYNHAQSLKLDFSETYTVSRRPTQVERGVLFLRKPGKMRRDY